MTSFESEATTAEALGEASAHVFLADAAFPAGITTTWHVEDALVREVFHDGIEIVTIERVQERLHDRDG